MIVETMSKESRLNKILSLPLRLSAPEHLPHLLELELELELELSSLLVSDVLVHELWFDGWKL